LTSQTAKERRQVLWDGGWTGEMKRGRSKPLPLAKAVGGGKGGGGGWGKCVGDRAELWGRKIRAGKALNARVGRLEFNRQLLWQELKM